MTVQNSADPIVGLEEACKKVTLDSEAIAEHDQKTKTGPVQHSMAAWQMEGRQLMEEAEAARCRARKIRVSGP